MSAMHRALASMFLPAAAVSSAGPVSGAGAGDEQQGTAHLTDDAASPAMAAGSRAAGSPSLTRCGLAGRSAPAAQQEQQQQQLLDGHLHGDQAALSGHSALAGRSLQQLLGCPTAAADSAARQTPRRLPHTDSLLQQLLQRSGADLGAPQSLSTPDSLGALFNAAGAGGLGSGSGTGRSSDGSGGGSSGAAAAAGAAGGSSFLQKLCGSSRRTLLSPDGTVVNAASDSGAAGRVRGTVGGAGAAPSGGASGCSGLDLQAASPGNDLLRMSPQHAAAGAAAAGAGAAADAAGPGAAAAGAIGVISSPAEGGLFAERSSTHAGAQQRLVAPGQRRGGGLTPLSPGELGSSQHVMSFSTPYPLLYRQINSQELPQHAASPSLPAPAAAAADKQAAASCAAAAGGSDEQASPAGESLGAETCTRGEIATAVAGAAGSSKGNGASSLLDDVLLLRQLQQQQAGGSCGAAAGAAAGAIPAGLECVPDLNALLRLVTSTGAPLYQMAAQVSAAQRAEHRGCVVSQRMKQLSSCSAGGCQYSDRQCPYTDVS
ncbi:hypothetical protein COO60DRAFT_980308 [Scenedesmus sp. NREL 46B-D3]|nr:hypothetical protein COO60DRAFT_980308 [Scenedesmus sp. NREL 46B-D3]